MSALVLVACTGAPTTQPISEPTTEPTPSGPAAATATPSGPDAATVSPPRMTEDDEVTDRAEPTPNPTPLPDVIFEDVPERLYPNPPQTAPPDDQHRTSAPGPRHTAGPEEGPRTPQSMDRPRTQITGFEESTRELQRIPVGLRPYQHGHVNPVPFGRVDSTGVRVFQANWDGQVYDHPIAQAQYALSALESYRLSEDQDFLDAAIANAQRIIDRKHVIDGAWYFPYDFDFDLFRNGRGVLEAPWASGMASGQALSTFVWLHEVTGDQKWRDAADHTFAAFLQAPDGAGYFSSFVDDEGLLWLEEYARYPVMDSERVLNGHMWSMFGIWDYWMMNDYEQPEAERLFRGALYTVEKTAMRDFRNPGETSTYSLWQGQPGTTYHQHHQQQFLMLYRMTHDAVWVSRASAYRSDFPEWRTTQGQAVITPQTTVAYRLDDTATHIKDRSMKVLATRELTIPAQTGAAYDRRGKIPGGPNVIRLSAGWLKGWWVEEKPGHAWSQELVEEHRYAPEAQLTVEAAQDVTIYQFDEHGTEIASQTVQLESGLRYRTDRSAIAGGRASYHLSDGRYAEWWLPEQPSVSVHRTPGWRVD